MEVRAGDRIVAPFECDLRIFIKLKERCPHEQHVEDKLLLNDIRKVNLDTLWSRETSMVRNTLTNAKKMIKASKVGMKGAFVAHGPMP